MIKVNKTVHSIMYTDVAESTAVFTKTYDGSLRIDNKITKASGTTYSKVVHIAPEHVMGLLKALQEYMNDDEQ